MPERTGPRGAGGRPQHRTDQGIRRVSKGTKRLLIILAFVVGLSYFAFTLLFFDPFEGSYMDRFEDTPVAIEYVVPRNVDFFAHKRALDGDFVGDGFPVPEVWKDIAWSRDWQQFERTPLYAELSAALGLEEKIEEIRRTTAEIPLLDPLADVLGRDAAVFGRMRGRGFDETEVAVVFLGSGSARFAFEAAGNGVIRSLLGIPCEVEELPDGVRKLTLEDGTNLYAHRDRDLFVVSTGPQLAGEVKRLLQVGREESLGYTTRYHATVAQDVKEFAGLRPQKVTAPEDLERRIQLHGNLTTWFADSDWDDEFREHRGEISRWLMAKLFNPAYFDELTIDLEIGDVLELRGMLGFDRERAENAQTGFYRNRTFDLKPNLERVAQIVPEDTYFLMSARVDMNRFLPTVVQALTSVDPKARELIDDVIKDIRRIRPDFRAQNADDMARSISGFLGDDVVIAMKRDSYFGAPDDPMPVVAMYFQVNDRGPTTQQLDAAAGGDPALARGYNGFIYPIMKANTQLKSQGRGVTKWYNVTHPDPKGQPHMVQDIILSGTDIKDVAFGIIEPPSETKGPWTLGLMFSARYLTRTNEQGVEEHYGSAHEMLTDSIRLHQSRGEAVRTTDYTKTASDPNSTREVRSLLRSRKFTEGSSFLDGFASAAAYLDAKAWKEVLIDGAEARAEAETLLDLAAFRAEREAELMDGEFASWKGKTMPQDVQDKLRRRLDDLVSKRQDEWRRDEVPAARQRYLESLVWLDFLRDAFFAARVDEASQNIELRARIRTDVE